MEKTIGVLALQGAFSLHKPHIEALGGKYLEVRKEEHFEKIDALILPGGESSVMLKHLENLNLFSPLKKFTLEKPVWGICAGVILLAQKVLFPEQESLGVFPIEVTRNYYGGQLESFEDKILDNKVSYIRAPGVKVLSERITIKHSYKENPVWFSYRNLMATTFHPELTESYPSNFHSVFYQKLES